MRDELEVLLDAETIQRRVAELADAIARDAGGEPLLVVGVLKGAWVFLADLVRRLPGPVEVDFLKVSSYGASTESSGTVRFELDLSRPVEGRRVVLVEDIVDTGVTLRALTRALASRGAASLKLCALLDKPDRRRAEVEIHYRGFAIPDRFVVGYGLDCAEQFRHLPFVAALSDEQARRIVGGACGA